MPSELKDQVLGILRFVEGNEWHAGFHVNGTSLKFIIGGIDEPDAARLEYAREIVREFSAFQKLISDFLASEAKRMPGAASEIDQLKIHEVALTSPKSANDGTISFAGPNKYRLWRCDYIEGRPEGLTFDD